MADHDSDSEAPEELTAEAGIKQDEELRRIQKENEIRVAREGKERRRLRAQRKAPQKSGGGDDDQRNALPNSGNDDLQEDTETDHLQEGQIIRGMLPRNIVDLLAAREKKTFSSDSEEEIVNQKPTTKKKKLKLSGDIFQIETLLQNEISAAQCEQSSMEFLRRRKMQVPRSSSVLKNPRQALRLLSSRGSLLSKT